jgi:hypothetical protein
MDIRMGRKWIVFTVDDVSRLTHFDDEFSFGRPILREIGKTATALHMALVSSRKVFGRQACSCFLISLRSFPSKMQRDEQCGVLSRRLAALCVFSELRDREWTIRTKIAVSVEICRLLEQIELPSRARCRIWKSFFNINSLSDHECLVRYRFRRKDLGFISETIPLLTPLAE